MKKKTQKDFNEEVIKKIQELATEITKIHTLIKGIKLKQSMFDPIQPHPIQNWSDIEHNDFPCLHDLCSQCHGTGRKANGEMCIHYLSCHCPKCSPRF